MSKSTKSSFSNVVPSAPKPVGWSNPDTSLLIGDAAPRPAFPSDLFGKFWGGWIEEVAASKNAPKDYVGASLLTLAAALIGNARTADAQGWAEPPVLWTVLVGNPSAGKSPAMDPFIDIIAELEAEAAAEIVAEDDRGGGTIHIDDATAQAAGEVSAHNPKGLILTKDELSHWYSRLGQTGGEGFWIKAYGARPERVDRKGKPPLRVRRLAINVLGGTQPSTLQRFITAKENKGFSSRWLYVFPNPVAGFRMAKPVDLGAAQAMLRRLWKLTPAEGKPVAVALTRQAVPKFEQWVSRKRDEAHGHGDGLWAEWLGKQGGVVLRLALVIEHLWWSADTSPTDLSGPTKISGPALTAAMRFIDEYSEPMASLTLGTAARPTEEQDAVQLLRLLQRKDEATFNARLLARGSHGPAGRLAQPRLLSVACEVLEHAGLIRRIGERAGGGKGRTASTYEVNPLLLGAR